MSSFKKCGIYPLNLGEVTDRQIAPSTLFSTASSDALPIAKPDSTSERDSLNKMRTMKAISTMTIIYDGFVKELPTKSFSYELIVHHQRKHRVIQWKPQACVQLTVVGALEAP